MKRLGPAVIIAMLGCAPHPRTAPQSTGSSGRAHDADAARCVIADASTPTRDTLYVVGAALANADSWRTECERHAASVTPVIIATTPAPGTDLRDVLDRGLPAMHSPRPDVVVTRDPNVLAYAAGSAEYFVVGLPYDRTYALVSADSAAAMPSQPERDALARDAVTGDTRGAVEPFAWITDASCVAPPVPSPGSPRSVIAYAAGDAIARQLAERIVALAGARARPAWLPASVAPNAALRVAAVAADSIAGEIATGRAAAAVLALPRDPHARCSTPATPLASRSVPLVDSRAHAIVRRGSGAAFFVAADGALRFTRQSAP